MVSNRPSLVFDAGKPPAFTCGKASMMGLGWLGALLVAGLLVAWAVRSLMKSEGPTAKVGLAVLAFFGGVAIIAVLARSFMHFGMMGGMMNCCG